MTFFGGGFFSCFCFIDSLFPMEFCITVYFSLSFASVLCQTSTMREFDFHHTQKIFSCQKRHSYHPQTIPLMSLPVCLIAFNIKLLKIIIFYYDPACPFREILKHITIQQRTETECKVSLEKRSTSIQNIILYIASLKMVKVSEADKGKYPFNSEKYSGGRRILLEIIVNT